MDVINERAYQLLHDGALAFAQAERTGIRIDVSYVEKQIKRLEKKEENISKRIFETKSGRVWRQKYGATAKIGSGEQLREVLAKSLGIRETGSMDKQVLATLKNPFVNMVLKYRKYRKARTTYLQNLISETTNGILHPFFNLHIVPTYRSSSNKPNFQNIPIRDPWVAKIVRRAFIPREGNRLVEADYSAIEVRIAACYHKDPRMLRYLKNGHDLHKEMAIECYDCKRNEVSKEMRYCAKNRFVFPIFYGSFYKKIAPALWDSIEEFDLKLVDGTPLMSHLKKRGMGSYSDFEDHIENVEHLFWTSKFKRYHAWKKEWYKAYLKQGYFDLKTGFRCGGFMGRNEVINYPIQGAAFHCLLWTFIEVQKEIRQRKMKTKLIGQIHDSILADVPENEFDDYLELISRVGSKKIREAWKWIILPLEMEIEACEVGESWFDKKEVKV